MSDAPVVQALPSAIQGVRRMLVRDGAGQLVEVVEAGANRAGRLPQGGVFAPFHAEEARIVLGPPHTRRLADLGLSPGAVMAVAGAVLRDLATLHASGGAHQAIDLEGWGFSATGVFQVRPCLHLPTRPGTPTEGDVAAVGQAVAALAPRLASEAGWERARFWLRGMGVDSDRIGFADARAAWQAWQALVGRRALGGELGAGFGPLGLKMPVPARAFAVRPVAGGQMRSQVLARDRAAAEARVWVLKELEKHRAERYRKLSERLEARAIAEVKALVAEPTEVEELGSTPESGQAVEELEVESLDGVVEEPGEPAIARVGRVEAWRAAEASMTSGAEERADRAAAERVAAEKAERLAEEEAEAERVAAEKVEAERVAAEKAEAERVAAEKAEAERVAAQKAEAEAERVAAERVAAEKAEADRVAAEKAEVDRVAAEKVEAERRAAEKAEADRVATEKAAAERLAAEKAEVDRLAAEKAAAEQAAADRLAAEKAEVDRVAAEKAAAERAAAEALPAVDPTTVPEPAEGWQDAAPRWSGAVGVTGDRAREGEKGPGKWVESGRSLEELRASLPEGPTRPLSLDEPKGRGAPAWLFPALAVAVLLALGAVVFLGLGG